VGPGRTGLWDRVHSFRWHPASGDSDAATCRLSCRAWGWPLAFQLNNAAPAASLAGCQWHCQWQPPEAGTASGRGTGAKNWFWLELLRQMEESWAGRFIERDKAG
jgi:hypothetical protein